MVADNMGDSYNCTGIVDMVEHFDMVGNILDYCNIFGYLAKMAR